MHPRLAIPLLIALPIAGCAAPSSYDVRERPASLRSSSDETLTVDSISAARAPRAAQEASGYRMPRKGDFEVTLGASGTNDEDFEAGSAALGGGVGYYLTDEFQLVGRQTLTFSDPGPGSDNWNGASRAGIDYNFRIEDSTIIPYVGALLGWVYGDNVDEQFVGGPAAGLKWYLRQDAFLQFNAEYQFFFDDEDRVGDVFEDGQFVYTLGFGVKF